MEQIRIRPHTEKKEKSFDALTLKGLGWLFTVAGCIALAFFPAESMEMYKMTLLMMGYLALPLFAFLTVEGFVHTSDLKKYILTMLASAVLAEPFYDYACSGSWLVLSEPCGQNPLFALVLSLVMLYFMEYLGDGSWTKVVGKIMVMIAAVIWGVMLSVRYGMYIVVVTGLFYLLRQRKVLQNVIIAVISIPWYITPELSLLFTSKYSGSRQDHNKYLFYAAYPAMWLVAVVIKLIIF